jgi:hypothetical protein
MSAMQGEVSCIADDNTSHFTLNILKAQDKIYNKSRLKFVVFIQFNELLRYQAKSMMNLPKK